MNGVHETKKLLGAGFTEEEVAQWQNEERTRLSSAGFNAVEINEYFGQREPDDKAMRGMIDEMVATQRAVEPETALSVADAIKAGWQMSASALVARGAKPSVVLPEDAPRHQRIASQVATLAGDVPFMIAGAVAGGAAGGTAGGAAGSVVPVVGTVAGAAAGTVIGGGAGAMAAPEAVRLTLMDHYENGSFTTFADFWDRFSAIALGTGKAAVIGGATAGVGGKVAATLAPLAAPVVVKATGVATSEIATMVTIGAALEGEMPNANDFVDAAILLGGIKGSVAVAGKLRTTYAKTGATPQQVAQAAASQPSVQQALASTNQTIPPAFVGPSRPTPTVQPPTPATPAPASAAQDAVMARVSVNEAHKNVGSIDKLYTAIKDDLFPIRRLVDEMAGGKKLPVSEDAYALARLTRGGFGKADQFLEIAPFEFNTYANTGGKSFKAIVEPVKNDLDGLRAYAVAARSLELSKRGIETGVPGAEAAAVVKAGAKYEPVFRELQGYQDSLVNYLRDAGVISKEAVEAMRDANKDYVPFFRLMEDGSQGGAGAGMKVKNPIKGIRGSDRTIIDPLESIIKNTYLYATLAERNAVGEALVRLAETTGNQALVSKVPGAVKPIEVTPKEVEAIVKEYGITTDQATAFTIFRGQTLTPAENQIVVFRGGKREVYEVDKHVAAAFKATDREVTPMLAKIIGLPARTLRAGSVLAPDFMMRNVVRDQLSATIYSQNGYVPVLDMVRGAISIAKRDGDFQNWLKSGGANATLVALDREYIQSQLFKSGALKEAGLYERTWNLAKQPIEWLRIASELMENSTRVGEFKKAAKGATDKASIQAAGFASREVTLDFARIGAKARAMNQITAFFNAGLEGFDRSIRALKDDPMGFTVKSAAAITTPSVLLWWANHDDPRYKEIPQWQKDIFWLVMTDDTVYRIPKPFEVGVMFGTVPERMLDAFFTDNPEALRDFDKTLGEMFGVQMIPTMAAPMIEQFANRSLFTGAPIIPYDKEGLLGEYQHNDYTTESAKAIAQLIGRIPGVRSKASDDDSFFAGGTARAITSPMILENYIRGWSGALGMYTLGLADKGLREAGVLPDPQKAASTLADIPVVKAFVVRYPSGSAASIQNFYDDYTAKKEVYDTFMRYAADGDIESAERVAKIDQTTFVQLDGVREALSTQTKVVHLINKNPDYTPEEKRQLIDSIYYQMIEIAKAGNAALRDADDLLVQ